MDEPAEVRQEIVDAARGYFLRFGYSRVSTDEIVKSINRSKKTLYKHFVTKEALLQAVLARINGEVDAQLLELFAGEAVDVADPETYLGALRRVLGRVASHLAATSGVLYADLKAKSGELYEQAHGQRRRALIALLGGFVARGVEAGHLRDDLAVECVLTVFLAGVESLADPVDAGPPVELFETLVTLTVDGMRRR